jgi:hypothetical protein
VEEEEVSPPAKKLKKKKVKKEKSEELDPLRAEAQRLVSVPSAEKPYHYKPEATNGDSKIIKFNKVPKNQCLYCA